MTKLKTPLIILTVVILLVVIKIAFLSPPKNPAAQLQGKRNSTPPSPVAIYVAAPRELNNNVFVTGSVIANEEVVLVPEVSGKLISLSIVEGSVVNKGDLLAKINDADLQAQLKKLELQAKIADEKVNRQKQLLSISGISQEEFDISLNLLNTAKADIDYTKALIAKTELRAPFSGTIGLKNVSEGSLVTPTTRIAAIQQLNQVKIDFSIPEKYADAITLNSTIQFTITDNKEIFIAKVYAIEPRIDQATRTIQLRALAANPTGKLFPGAFAKIQLPLKKISNAIMIPTEAIIPVLKGKKVFVCKNGKAQQLNVETGIRTDSLIQVINGLQAGDSVITTGIMQLKQDNLVRVVRK
ncbi:MAG: efflux RND transporter periplasmic adaptor subunit [Bacteroidetes bacterium]|nr:efflux RND transporter periplasmic adaptor subunit [Bacteroidota bacterium]